MPSRLRAGSTKISACRHISRYIRHVTVPARSVLGAPCRQDIGGNGLWVVRIGGAVKMELEGSAALLQLVVGLHQHVYALGPDHATDEGRDRRIVPRRRQGRKCLRVDACPAQDGKPCAGIYPALAQQRQIVLVLDQQVGFRLPQHRRHQAQRTGAIEPQQSAGAETEQTEPGHVHNHAARRDQLEGEAAQHHGLHRHQMHHIGRLRLENAGKRPGRDGLSGRIARGPVIVEVDDPRAERLDLAEPPGRTGNDDNLACDLPEQGDERLKMR